MDKITTTDCYLPVIRGKSSLMVTKKEGAFTKVLEGEIVAVEKHSGMIVLTVEQFEKIVGDAFIAGRSAGMELISFANNPENPLTKPNLIEYIATLLK